MILADLRAARRAVNRERILLELHQAGPLQRIVLSERLGIRANSVGNISNELLEWGIISENSGSPANQLCLEPSKPFFITSYIGVHVIIVAKVFMDGRVEIHSQTESSAFNNPQEILNEITNRIENAVGSDDAYLCGIGITLPGFVDNSKGIVRHAANLPGWHNISVTEHFQKTFNRMILVENEVRCHLWNDIWFERRKETSSTILYLLIVEGISCAILARGRLLQGNNAASGEIGHVPCDNQGRLCACGKEDCLEAYCSEPALFKEVKAMNLTDSTEMDFMKTIAKIPHNAELAKLFNKAAERLAKGIAPVVAALDPKELILACRDTRLAEALRNPLRYRLQEYLMGLPAFDLSVITTQASEETALCGVAGLLMQSYFKGIGSMKPAPNGHLPVIPTEKE